MKWAIFLTIISSSLESDNRSFYIYKKIYSEYSTIEDCEMDISYHENSDLKYLKELYTSSRIYFMCDSTEKEDIYDDRGDL